MAQAIKLFLVPGSVQFLAIGLVAGIACLFGGPRLLRWSRRWLVGLVAFYVLLSMPVGADLVTAPLTWQYHPLQSAEQAKGIDTVVVLSTGLWPYRANGLEVDDLGTTSAYNTMEGARLYRLLGGPTLLVTGGIVDNRVQDTPEALAVSEALVRLGVPRERMVLETDSRTTAEQAANSARLLRARHTARIVLVTNTEHMSRALSAFRAAGLDAIPSASVVRQAVDGGIVRLRPSLAALQQSERACYEYLARAYYGLLRLAGRN